MRKQARGLFTLVVFFGKIPAEMQHSNVGSVIWCLCQNLHQQRTIIVNLANVYKVRRLAAGLCSPCFPLLRLCFFLYSFLLVFYAPVCLERLCVWGASRVAERSSGCHRGAAPREAGASLINACWCRRLQRGEGMRGLCCYLLLCLCTTANRRPANGITASDEWALG